MSGDNIGRHIICRMLDWSERVNVLSMRKYYDSSRMLSGTSADSGTASYDTIDLTVSLTVTTLS